MNYWKSVSKADNTSVINNNCQSVISSFNTGINNNIAIAFIRHCQLALLRYCRHHGHWIGHWMFSQYVLFAPGFTQSLYYWLLLHYVSIAAFPPSHAFPLPESLLATQWSIIPLLPLPSNTTPTIRLLRIPMELPPSGEPPSGQDNNTTIE